ncbi:hypothetical protein PybrP1_005642 [[Pythium] brassicae (nom. inval.)]|nr:hypothetical protein PybrP1_005642 [[Pythium] brassicae (nom. inval.)]
MQHRHSGLAIDVPLASLSASASSGVSSSAAPSAAAYDFHHHSHGHASDDDDTVLDDSKTRKKRWTRLAASWLPAWLTKGSNRQRSGSSALPRANSSRAIGKAADGSGGGILGALWWRCPCTRSSPRSKRVAARLARSSRLQLLVLAVLLLALFVGISVLLLEGLGRLRFRGYFVGESGAGGSGRQLGFYHEMDVDMQALRDATQRPAGQLFPVGAGHTAREVAAWVTERRRRTNGRKFLVGCSADWHGYVLRSFLHLFTELTSPAVGWEDLTTQDPVGYFYAQDPHKAPSVLLFCLNSFHYPMALLLEHTSYFQDLRALGTLLLVWNDDLHYYDQFDPLVLRHQILTRADVLVGTYAYQMDEYFASVTRTLAPRDLPLTLWLPHAAGPDFTRAAASFNDHPINKLLLAGAHGANWYPLRHWLGQYQEHHREQMDVYHHAGYYPPDNQTEVFATYLRAYRAGITTTLLFQYVIAKLFEIPATGALLVVNRDVAPLLAALGLVDGTHYVGFDRADPAPAITWVLDPANRALVDRIRRAGWQLVRAQHMVAHRVHALDLFVTDGRALYNAPADYALASPCPSVALPDADACEKRFAREAVYKCDRWFCGAHSVLGV